MNARAAIVSFLFAGVAAAQTANPTFSKDVLPILQKNCQSCHRPGQVAPMSFLTYESARPWAKAMKVAVLTKKMPPWFADPGFSHFSNDRSLPQTDIETIAKSSGPISRCRAGSLRTPGSRRWRSARVSRR